MLISPRWDDLSCSTFSPFILFSSVTSYKRFHSATDDKAFTKSSKKGFCNTSPAAVLIKQFSPSQSNSNSIVLLLLLC